MTFRLSDLIDVLRKAVSLGVQGASTLIVYLIDQERLDAVPESLTTDSDWNQEVGYWEQISNLSPDNVAEIASYDDEELRRLVGMYKCFVSSVGEIIAD